MSMFLSLYLVSDSYQLDQTNNSKFGIGVHKERQLNLKTHLGPIHS